MVSVYNVGALGDIRDIPPHLLPPEAWSFGRNMQMVDGYCRRSKGYSATLLDSAITPGFVMAVPGAVDNFWLWTSLTAAYGYDGVTEGDITRLAGAYTAQNYRDWNGCILGGVPVINNGQDVPQYWPNLSIATDLANLTNWPATLRAKVVRNFGAFLVAINLNDNSTLLPQAIQWSHPAEPGTLPSSWDYTDPAVDAGRIQLTDAEGGDLLDGYLLGDYLVLYKQRSCHLLRFVGGVDILASNLLFGIGLLAPRCAAPIDAGRRHFCVGEGEVYIHSGTKEVMFPLQMKDKRYLFSDIDTTNFLNAFAFDIPEQEEVWFAYPSQGQEYPDKALVYNYRTGVPYFRDFAGISHSRGFVPATDESWDSSSGVWDDDLVSWNIPVPISSVVADPIGDSFWKLNDGYTFGTLTEAYLQREELSVIGRDRTGGPKADFAKRKLITRVWPKVRGDVTLSVRVWFKEHFGQDTVWTTPKSFEPEDLYVDFEASGRLAAVEFKSLNAADWTLEGYDVEIVEIAGY